MGKRTDNTAKRIELLRRQLRQLQDRLRNTQEDTEKMAQNLRNIYAKAMAEGPKSSLYVDLMWAKENKEFDEELTKIQHKYGESVGEAEAILFALLKFLEGVETGQITPTCRSGSHQGQGGNRRDPPGPGDEQRKVQEQFNY